MARVGGGVGERDVFLIRIQDAGVVGLARDHANDGAERGDAESDLAVDTLGFVTDEDAAVELVVVEEGDAHGDVFGAPVVVEEELFRAVLIDAEIGAASVAVEGGALGHDVDGAARAAGAVEEALRAAHDIGALDIEEAVHAGAGAERAGETIAAGRTDADAADAHGLVADAIAGLLAEGVRFGVRHDGARAGAVVQHQLLEVGDTDIANKIFGKDIGGDGDVFKRGVELGERVRIEGAVAVIGRGLHLEGIEGYEVGGGFFLGGGDFGGGGSWRGGLTESRREEREWREEEGGANQGVHGW